jgi:hypothetical protein
MVPEIEVAFLWCSGWAIARCDAHNNDEDGYIYAKEPCPGSILVSAYSNPKN